MSKQKGDKRERQARQIYENAGYEVESPNYTRFQNTDYWNLFDFMAARDDHVAFVQVKSNTASGIRDWMEDAEALLPDVDGVKKDFVVCHDREGWRLMRPTNPPSYSTKVDERKLSCNMGEKVTDWLVQR